MQSVPDRKPSEMWDATTGRSREMASTVAENSREMASTVADVSRVTTRDRLEALRVVMPALVQTAVGASIAWLIATRVFGHTGAFFAPVSVIICLGLTYGQRTRRAFELSFAVALGIGIGDIIVLWLGSGAWQLLLVTLLAMMAAVLLGGSRLVVTQAASSAILVATIQVPHTFTFTRFTDALIGGTVAVVMNLVVAPLDPVRLVRRSAQPLLQELAEVLDALAVALTDRDHDAVVEALMAARDMDSRTSALLAQVTVGVETARYAPLRRRHLPEIERYAHAAPQLELATRNVRVLARGVLRAVDLEAHIPPEAPAALRDLAEAVRATRRELFDPEGAPANGAQAAVLRAAGRTQMLIERTNNLSISVIVGQIRSTCADLLRGMGMTWEEARVAVRAATADVEARSLAADPAPPDVTKP